VGRVVALQQVAGPEIDVALLEAIAEELLLVVLRVGIAVERHRRVLRDPAEQLAGLADAAFDEEAVGAADELARGVVPARELQLVVHERRAAPAGPDAAAAVLQADV